MSFDPKGRFMPEFRTLPTGAVEFRCVLDPHDARSISEAILQRIRNTPVLPDATHDDATFSGRVLAEVCRGWLEAMELTE